ncbi:MAG: hypothetical protein ACKOCD_05760 [Nitrospiraceae bacterium]
MMGAKARRKSFVAMAGLALALGACLPSQWEYLGRANGQATQDEVKQQLGEPHDIKTLADQTQAWTYRYEGQSSFPGVRGDMRGGAPCIDYILRFDSKQVLNYWTRQPCSTL